MVMTSSSSFMQYFMGRKILIFGCMFITILRCIFDFELSRNQRQGSEFFSREVEFMRWFPVAFQTPVTNGVLKVTHGGIELTTPVL